MKPQPLSDGLKSDIVKLWCRILEADNISLTDDFFLDLGGTSLKAVHLLIELETDLGLMIPMAAFTERPTLERLFEIAGSPATERSSSLVPLQPRGSSIPLFFAHAESGHVLFAQELANALGQDQPMYGLQAQGFQVDERPLTSIPDMAVRYIGEMKNIQPQGPYRIGGFCMGALLALEMACQLDEAGEEVSHLVVFSTDAHWMRTKRLRDHLEFHRREIGQAGLGNAARYVLSRIHFRLHRLYSSAIFCLHLMYEKRGKSLSPKLRYVCVAESNYRASWDFHPRPFNGGLFYFEGGSDRRPDPLSFWRKLILGGIEVKTVVGYRHTIFDQPYVDALASSLAECLSRPASTLPQGVEAVSTGR
jgi:thioesterase domain-containing protein/acyl carrier protein